jgi:hypothetical protein
VVLNGGSRPRLLNGSLARFLRSYLRALRRTVEREGLEGLVAKRQKETIDFLAWAQHYADQLDPLCTTPHDPDFEAERPGYYMSADKQVHETLDRFFGNHWSEAFKVDGIRQTSRRRPEARLLSGSPEGARESVRLRTHRNDLAVDARLGGVQCQDFGGLEGHDAGVPARRVGEHRLAQGIQQPL